MSEEPGASPPEWIRIITDRLTELPRGFFGRFEAPAEGGRESAVLMLFGPGTAASAESEGDPGAEVVLTERATGLRSHPGQVSFPGGRVDAGDPGPVAAALREAAEEICLPMEGVEVQAEFPALYLPVSDSRITPVLAWWSRPQPLSVCSPVEVERVLHVPVAELVDPANRFTVTHPSGYRGPAFEASGAFIWGFTAGLLSMVLDLAGLGRPWDTDLTRQLPQRFLARPAPPVPVVSDDAVRGQT